jgi:tetratricopeptide (TPR) repeat protein
MIGRRTLALAVFTCLIAARAFAQQPADLDRAKESFKAGAAAYAAGEYLAAIQALDAAYELTPLPAIAFSLAQAERRQYFVVRRRDHLDRAITLFRRYIDQVPSGGRRIDALDALSQLEPFAATLTESHSQTNKEGTAHSAEVDDAVRHTRVMITADNPGSRISLDGSQETSSPLIREVEPGGHRVRISAAGFFPEEREVTAVVGELIPISVLLRERPSTVTVAAPADAELYVDGAFASRGGDHVALQLSSGIHRLNVAEKGHRVSFHLVDLGPGEAQSIQVSLERTWQRRAAQALFLGGGIAFGTGIVLAILTIDADHSAQDFLSRQATGNVSSKELSDYRAAVTNRNHYRTATAVTMASSLAFLLAGFLLYQIDRPDPQELNRPTPSLEGDPSGTTNRATGRPSAHLRFVPVVTPAGAGGVLQSTL